ncbi:Fe-S cluster assembly protein HesB [Nocardia terpenica]|uniref:Fe-S cluster assembly protein HesB n=1 Tax=Nocardia terpenica TaxID=455432 RepID=A0A164ID63_9NOCA|nr:Fe-S cluster assembly protein HesB [Nocardia terpenica]MBF6062634.1 Fe-S cluster assembly protein HesB [Nocardia terpenica]MBF6104722.1 Fe-S cluster assembly protein HesB [Nocardia terpenica]MBF6123406.1 Fe-S cluster assembly protein HesB [Nocardia terpenica]MBF6156937.1 Fe-S cluster assembly protein HesB [Nocardia terpenica]
MSRKLCLAQEPEADALLSEDDFALLTGMLLDQQYPLEHAFRGPRKIADRMDGFDIHKIAEADPQEFEDLCSTPPAIHRYGRSMARRTQDLARYVVEHYGGETSRIWTEGDPDGKEVLRRLKDLPGYGDQKARIFLAMLGKQLGVEPKGWEKAAGAYSEKNSRRSAADIVDGETLLEVRAFKKQMKAAAKKS